MTPWIDELKEETPGLNAVCVPEMEEMLKATTKPYPYTKTWESAKNDNCMTFQTSGTTGTPKPIYYNHRFLATFDLHRFIPTYEGRVAVGAHCWGDRGDNYFMVFPCYHLTGLTMGLASLWYESTLVLPPTGVPANGKIIIEIMRSTELSELSCPPSILEDLVSEYADEFLRYSRNLKVVIFIGGPLARATGDFLIERMFVGQGIGSTETAMLPSLIPEHKYWQYFEWHPTHIGYKLEPIEEGSGLYEMVIYRDPKAASYQGVFMTHPHLDVWRTKDLLQKHPTENLWLFSGRRDDVIVLSNGEKFNPVTMEGIVQGHSKVSGALVVGMGRTQCAMLLEVRGGGEAGSTIEEAWPTIDKANEISPQHAQIARNMIIVINPANDPAKRFREHPRDQS